MNQGFAITSGKGFQIYFPNGYGVSVQFGPGNYGDHYDDPITGELPQETFYRSHRAEVAVFGPNKDERGRTEMLHMESFGGSNVGGYWLAQDVVSLLWWAMHQEGEPKEDVLIGPEARERAET